MATILDEAIETEYINQNGPLSLFLCLFSVSLSL